MRTFIKRAVKKILYIIRIRPPKRLLTVKKYLRSNTYKPSLVAFYDLKELTLFLASINKQDYYNDLLEQLVDGYKPVIISQSHFIGQGAGKFILNTYRQIELQDKILFEKVYFSESRKFKSVQWFYKNYYYLLSDNLIIPKLHHVYLGDLVSIFHYEFLGLNKKKVSENELIILSKQLMHATSSLESSGQEIPGYVKDYKAHNAYSGYIAMASKSLENEGIHINELEKAVESSKHYFAHGDIHEENIFSGNIVIDWDFFGCYPIGFEQAQMYCQMLVRNKKDSSSNAIQWLEVNYKEDFEWHFQEMLFNFIYFLYVFCHTLFIHERCLELKPVLLKQIQLNLKHND